MEQRVGRRCRRLLAVSAVIVYSAVTFGFLALHAVGDQGWYPTAYFFTWDMFPIYYYEASRRIAVGRTRGGQYVRLHPGPFDRFRGGVHADLTKVDLDRSGRLFRRAVEHTLAMTSERQRLDPVTHVFLLEQYWPEKFNLPPDLYEAWAGAPRPDRKYWRVTGEFDVPSLPDSESGKVP